MNPRLLLVIVHDLVAVLATWVLAFLLRYNFDLPAGQWTLVQQTLPLVAAIQMATFWKSGLYRGLWRFASLPDLRRIVLAAALSGLLVTLALFMLQRGTDVPRSVLGKSKFSS